MAPEASSTVPVMLACPCCARTLPDKQIRISESAQQNAHMRILKQFDIERLLFRTTTSATPRPRVSLPFARLRGTHSEGN
jgi:hypothetical protein